MEAAIDLFVKNGGKTLEMSMGKFILTERCRPTFFFENYFFLALFQGFCSSSSIFLVIS